MIEFRDQYAKEHGWNLIVESNMEAFNAGVGPCYAWQQSAYRFNEDTGVASRTG